MVCESCLYAATEEGGDEGGAEDICLLMGADIADHICDRQEGAQCDCACGEYEGDE